MLFRSFYFSDLVVGETTCDGKKKMCEMMSEFKPVHVVQLPNSQTEAGMQMYRQELIDFKNLLEETFETAIPDDAVREQIHIRNEINAALVRLQYTMAHNPAPVSGLDISTTSASASAQRDWQKKLTTLRRKLNRNMHRAATSVTKSVFC